MINFSDFIGLVGISLSTYSYAKVQWHRDFAKSFSYSALNLLGSTLMGFSLLKAWNLASFVSNALWWSISVYGLYRCSKYAWSARRIRISAPGGKTTR